MYLASRVCLTYIQGVPEINVKPLQGDRIDGYRQKKKNDILYFKSYRQFSKYENFFIL